MESIKFELDNKEVEAANKFFELHKDCCHKILNKPVFSTIGGGFSYIITPTGLGNCISIECNSCGEIKDITNSDNW